MNTYSFKCKACGCINYGKDQEDNFVCSMCGQKIHKSDVKKLKSWSLNSMLITFLCFLIPLTLAIHISNTYISGVIGALTGLFLRVFLEKFLPSKYL